MADSPLASLKVAELLKEVQVDYGKTQAIEAGLAAIRRSVSEIPEEEVSPSLAAAYLHDLRVPPVKGRFKFRRPDAMEVVGSFATETVAKPIQNVDLAVNIPKACFHEKDYLNHRYHAKRVLYLVVLRKHLLDCSAVRDVEWALQHSDARKPILLVHLASFKANSFTAFAIQILPTIAPDVFDVAKLAPSRNNIREANIGEVITATPHYNSSILEDMYIIAHCAFLKKAISQSNALREGVVLLKVWMRQRGFLNAPDSLNGFLMSVILVHVVTDARCRPMASMLTGLQAFRICLEAIANGDLLGKGLFLQKSTSCEMDHETKETLARLFDVILFDASGYLNLSFRLTKNALEEIKEEASCTLAAMKGSRDHGFEETFMITVDYAAKYDYHIRINGAEDASEATSLCCADEGNCRSFERKTELLLCESLGDRARLVRVTQRSLPSDWSVEKGVMSCNNLPVSVGVKLSNFETSFRMIDIGPSADNKEKATKFRAFWGTKAELRRFKDGTIAETVVWECKSWQRHLIIQKIVEHVLSLHMSLSKHHIHVVAGQLDFALMEGNHEPIAVTPRLLEAYEDFGKKLRSLEDLPLKISSVQPLSSAFRHTAVFPPQIHQVTQQRQENHPYVNFVPSYIDPLEVMIQLEGSGKWPSNSTAIEKTKFAFGLKIAESMQRVHGATCIAAEDAVDLLMHGFCFRLRIHYEKDPTLVKERHDQLPLLKQQISDQALKDVNTGLFPEDDLLLRSLHSSMLNGLQGRFPVYSSTVRLAKRWVCSHLFSGVLGDEVIELLVAHVFLKPAPFSSPSSRVTGLLRFLLLLAKYDWALSPIIVDVNGDMTSKELDYIVDYFNCVRNSLHGEHMKTGYGEQGGPAMFVATAIDMRSLSWTSLSPSNLDLKRLVAYARSSADLLSLLITGERPGRWQSLFRTPLHLYDIVLILQRKKLPHPSRVLFPAETGTQAIAAVKYSDDEPLGMLSLPVSNDGLQGVEKQFLIGFDPVKYFVQDMKDKFGNILNFWYDSLGNEVIGLTWRHPLTCAEKAPVSKRRRVVKDFTAPDTRRLLSEIGEIGDGFLKSVHLISHLTK